MPLYEYKCAKCRNVFEVLQKFSDQPLTVHKDCGGALERLISPSVFQFKGSGWYVTDSRSKSSAVTDSAADSTDSGPPAEPAAAPAPATSTEAPAAP